MTDIDASVIDKPKLDLKTILPKKWNVVFYNDNMTSFDFVISELVNRYGYSQKESIHMATKIHDKGKSIVASYYKEVAEQRKAETVSRARSFGYPLKVEIFQQ